MDATLTPSAQTLVEIIDLAPTLPTGLDPTLYEGLVVAMSVSVRAPDGTTSEPKIRWSLATSSGVEVKVNRRHERGHVIDLANRIIVARLAGNQGCRTLYLASVAKAKVQGALDDKAFDKELAPTPVLKSVPKPLAPAPADHALPCLLTPAPAGGGNKMQFMTKPAAADLSNGIGVGVPRECNTLGGWRSPAPLGRSLDSPPPIKGQSLYRNHKGVFETPSLIGAEMAASIKMARGPKDTPSSATPLGPKKCYALPLTTSCCHPPAVANRQ